jgi:acyl-CoA thioesterase I
MFSIPVFRFFPAFCCTVSILSLTGFFLAAAEIHPLLPQGHAAGYKLAWQDEFERTMLDSKEWTPRTGDRFASRNLARNVTVSGGRLRLLVQKEKAGELEYTSGGVISKREFRYGCYEARFKAPAGAGWHTSFWLMKNAGRSTGNRQEIDICEHDSKDQTSYGANLHTHFPKHTGLAGRRISTPDLSKDFHTWTTEFSPHEIRHYFDGKFVGMMHATGFAHDDMSIWLTTVGWSRLPWAPQLKIDDTQLPAYAEFEYVRFFTKPGLESETAPVPRTVVVFGDSLTEGGALPKDQRDQSWLKRVERESGGKLRLINEGKGGRPTDSMKDFEAMWKRQPRADLLVIALGTNDSRDLSSECVPKATANLTRMIDRARSAWGPGLPVLLVGPPNINQSALGPTKPIGDQREARLKELSDAFAVLAAAKSCQFVSLFGVLPDETLTKDGVHPDAHGNATMAAVLQSRLLPD